MGRMTRLFHPRLHKRTSRDQPRVEAVARERASQRAVDQRSVQARAADRRLRELTILSRLKRDYPTVYAACDPDNDTGG